MVPEGWEVRPLGEVVNFLDGKRKPLKSEDRKKINGPYPYYGATGVIDWVNDYIFDDELILMGEDGENILSRSLPHVFQISGQSWVNNHAHVLKPKSSSDIGYLTAYLESLRYEKYNSGSAQPKLNKAVCEKIPVLLPPLPEQKKIAQILSTWDQAITATERLLENSQQRKKGLMQHLLIGKKRLPGFEGEWREEELGKLVAISKGEQLNRSTLSEAGLYPVINGGITPSGYTDKTNCHGNTVTISEGGNSCGFVAFQQVPFWCGGHCYALKSPQVPVMFLYQLLKLYEVKIMRMRVGSGLPNIQKKDLSSLKLCLPSCPDEQEAIGQILGLADKECRLLVDRLNSLKQEKKALMQQLLTGKRRVQVDTEAA